MSAGVEGARLPRELRRGGRHDARPGRFHRDALARSSGLRRFPRCSALRPSPRRCSERLVIRALSRNRDANAMPALAAGLAIATLVLISPHYPWYFCWLVPFICFLPRCVPDLSDLVGVLTFTSPMNPFSLLTGLVIYAPALASVRFRAAPVFSCRSCNKDRSRDCPTSLPRPSAAAISRRSRKNARPMPQGPGLPLSRGDEPLQPALHHLPAHLRGAGAGEGHGLGHVHLDRRSVPKREARRPAWRRRADDGEGLAAHGRLSQGARHLCPVQHQRHSCSRQRRAAN